MKNKLSLLKDLIVDRLKEILLMGITLKPYQSIILIVIGVSIVVSFRIALKALHFPPSLASVMFWGILFAVPFTNRSVVFSLILSKSAFSIYMIFSNPMWRRSINGVYNNLVYFFASLILAELIFRVINGLRELTHKLELESKKTEEASAAKAIFMANMSHEIRTPISGIQGISAMMLSQETLLQADRNNLMLINSSADTLTHIVDSVLNFSRIEAGKEEVEHKPFHIKPVIRQLITSIEFTLNKSNVKLELNFKGSIPEIIVSDATKIKQILTNLITNGVKFSSEGCVTINISVVNKLVPCLKIEVIDTGIGIPDDKRELIFSKFERVSTKYEDKAEGTGLGLAITRELTHLLKGEISLKSRVGEGSTFSVEFPIETVDEFDTKAPLYKESEKNIVEKIHKVLLAEDNSVNQIYIKHFLEKNGYDLTIAENGEEAVNFFKSNNFNVVLMDIQMPIKSGVQATKEIREFEKENNMVETPIFALTASVTEPEQKSFLEAGMNSVCPKPINMGALITDMRGHICN